MSYEYAFSERFPHADPHHRDVQHHRQWLALMVDDDELSPPIVHLAVEGGCVQTSVSMDVDTATRLRDHLTALLVTASDLPPVAGDDAEIGVPA